MTKVYIVQNQDKRFLSKQRGWVDGREPTALFRTPHKDEAVNEMFEANARDYSQRVALIECPVNDKKVPQLNPEWLAPKSDELALETETPEAESPTS